MWREKKSVPTLAAATALLLWLTPVAVRAHGNNPPYIAFWGGFDPGAARCQEIVGKAGQRCFQRALALETGCLEATLRGDSCDAAALARDVSAAKKTGVDEITAACTDDQVRQLVFQGLGETTADLTIACGDEPQAAMSLMYAPAHMQGGAADDAVSRCMQATTTSSARLLRFSVRQKRRMLDRIALQNLKPSQKLGLFNHARDRVAAARTVAAALITQHCPDFEAVYGRTLADFLVQVELRGDCVVFAGYVQSAVTCPLPVCGNGIKETGESCDDGNTVDGDGCDPSCRAD